MVHGTGVPFNAGSVRKKRSLHGLHCVRRIADGVGMPYPQLIHGVWPQVEATRVRVLEGAVSEMRVQPFDSRNAGSDPRELDWSDGPDLPVRTLVSIPVGIQKGRRFHVHVGRTDDEPNRPQAS